MTAKFEDQKVYRTLSSASIWSARIGLAILVAKAITNAVAATNPLARVAAGVGAAVVGDFAAASIAKRQAECMRNIGRLNRDSSFMELLDAAIS